MTPGRLALARGVDWETGLTRVLLTVWLLGSPAAFFLPPHLLGQIAALDAPAHPNGVPKPRFEDFASPEDRDDEPGGEARAAARQSLKLDLALSRWNAELVPRRQISAYRGELVGTAFGSWFLWTALVGLVGVWIRWIAAGFFPSHHDSHHP